MAEEYQLGHGVEIGPYLSIGGYFSANFENSQLTKEYMIDDVAIMAYGRLDDRLSYLLELEAVEFLVRDFGEGTTSTNMKFRIERAYVGYKLNDYADLRVGKFITPIGHWNLNPINVLRDTTSNPRYAQEIFPKFTTGVMLWGYLPSDDSWTYNIFGQHNKDLDANYNNIETDDYYGVEVKKRFGELEVGANMGDYEVEEEHFRYYGVTLKYEHDRVQILSEYSALAYNNIDSDGDTHEKYAYYVQGRYKLSSQHYLVSRYEQFTDDFHDVEEEILLFGYNYRPIHPVSIKCEYQFNSDEDKNRFLLSFSMLF